MSREQGKRFWLRAVVVLSVSAVLLAADQIIKYFVLRSLEPLGSVTVIGGLLEFRYTENTGVAFGLLAGRVWFIAVLTALVFVGVVFALFRYRNHTFFSLAAAALLIAGGIGNFIDRIAYGFVVDFIHVLFFGYIFNFADCCITVGAVLLVIHVLLITYREKRAEKEAAAPQEGEE